MSLHETALAAPDTAGLAMPRRKPTREQAERAVRTPNEWIGENHDREGLVDTLARLVRSYEELFGGNLQDPATILERTSAEGGEYEEVELRNGGREGEGVGVG